MAGEFATSLLDEFHIGVLGETGVVSPLTKIAKYKKIVDRRTGASLAIRLHQFNDANECVPCHILFVAESATPESVAIVMQQFAELPVLVVGETPGFARAVGDAEFQLVDGEIRFELNLDHASNKNLKLDAKLLKAANSILKVQQSGAVTQN
jgi:hypothetical protein